MQSAEPADFNVRLILSHGRVEDNVAFFSIQIIVMVK